MNLWSFQELQERASNTVIRFKLKTLLALTAIVALATITWTIIPKSFWSYLPESIRVEDANLAISFGPIEISPVQLPNGDILIGVSYDNVLLMPLWVVGLLATIFIATLFVGFIFRRKRKRQIIF